jgi:hypothetical protein
MRCFSGRMAVVPAGWEHAVATIRVHIPGQNSNVGKTESREPS